MSLKCCSNVTKNVIKGTLRIEKRRMKTSLKTSIKGRQKSQTTPASNGGRRLSELDGADDDDTDVDAPGVASNRQKVCRRFGTDHEDEMRRIDCVDVSTTLRSGVDH